MGAEREDGGARCRSRGAEGVGSRERERRDPVLCGAHRALLAAALLTPLLGALPSLALDPARRTTQYVADSWTQDDGLPQNAVNAIAQTPDGYLWLGTEEGLVRFDGARFTVFDRRTTPQIRNNFVMALHADRAGDLWIGTFGGGLVRMRKGRFELFTKDDGLTSERIRSIAEDDAGTLWIATGGGGLLRYEKGRFSAITTKEGLASDRVWSVAEDARGRLAIGTFGGGLQLLEAGKLSAQPLGPGAASAHVRPVCLDRDGSLWVGTDGGGLYRIRGDEVRSFGPAEGLTSPLVRALWPDRDGNLWVGTDGAGLFRYRDGRFEPYAAKDGLANDFVLSLFEDREGSLWIGTSGGGLARLRDGKVTNLTTREGLGNDVVRAVVEGRDGALWVGTTGGGVTRFADGKASTLRVADGLRSDLVFALHEDRDGRLWIGTDGAGVSVLEKGRLRGLTSADGLVNDRVRSIAEDGEGSIWIGTVSGLSRYRAGAFTSYTTKEGLAGSAVRALLPGRDGSLWIGTDGGGLGRLKDGAFTSWKSADGLSSARVFSLHEDERGTLWIGTSGGGLNRLSGGKIRAITSADGLLDDVVFQILDDGAGSLWMSCNRGIFRVSRDELDRFADGRLTRVTSRAFGRSDGMLSAECNGGSPAGIRTRDGRLRFPTIRGLASIDPARLPSNPLVPAVLVEEIHVDGRRERFPAGLHLPPGVERVELRYTATSLVVPGKVRFRYRLEGFDRAWVEAGDRRTTTYTNLRPGRYTFRVLACNDDGVWNVEGASLAFSIAPFFWQTGWFLALALLAVAASVFVLHRLRVRRHEGRERELERIVEERTVELTKKSEKLQQAQEQIEKLSSTTSGILEDPATWARSVAREMAHAIGASEIGIWLIEDEAFVPLDPCTLRAPQWNELRRALREGGTLERASGLLVPVLGMTSEPRGVIVVEGPEAAWGEVQRRVLTSLARHLGTALDLRALRERLVTSESSRRAHREELHRKGLSLAAVCPVCHAVLEDRVGECPRDAVPLDWSRFLPIRPGERYLLLRWLGEGGMGTVFLARDERLQREVVLKLIRPDRLRDAGTRLRFEREARIVAQIHHPGVVAVFDTGELDDGSTFLVMEHLWGMSLAEVIDGYGPGAPAQVALLARQVGGALDAAHRAGVVHRDVKPGNVFLVPDGPLFQAKVLDFGVAKSRVSDSHRTQTGIIVGTPTYMSPEQVRGQAVDARSDLYAFGTILHESLSGRRLVPDAELSRVFAEVLHQPPPSLAERIPGLPAEVDALLGMALAKRREDRPEGVLPWAETLARALEEIPPGTTPGQGWPAIRGGASPRRGAAGDSRA